MSIYVVTKSGDLLEYSAPDGYREWIGTEETRYRIFKSEQRCGRSPANNQKSLMSYVDKDEVVSIGFIKPVTIEGRMLNWSERSKLTTLRNWLAKRRLPRKIDATPLEKLLG